MSLFRPIVDAVVKVAKGIRKVNFFTLMVDLISYVPSIAREIATLVDMKKDGLTPIELKVIIDDALLEFDEATGVDESTGERKLIPLKGIPVDKQEECYDHFKELVKIILYNRAKIEGYFESDKIDEK